MKTSEFKKRLEELSYKVTLKRGLFLDISTHRGKHCAEICIVSKFFALNTVSLELAKLCIEYVETPISEREDEKKYTVVLPDPKNGYDVKYMLTKQNGEVTILRAHRCHLTPLTESEIKRNHEYLWQFAKEVQE